MRKQVGTTTETGPVSSRFTSVHIPRCLADGYGRQRMLDLQRLCTCWDSFPTLTPPDRSPRPVRALCAPNPHYACSSFCMRRAEHGVMRDCLTPPGANWRRNQSAHRFGRRRDGGGRAGVRVPDLRRHARGEGGGSARVCRRYCGGACADRARWSPVGGGGAP